MRKCAVIDDEPLARKLIASHLSHIDGLELVQEFNDAIEALNYLQKNKVDLLFLDIQMPDLTGIEFLKTMVSTPAVVFVTAYRDFAPEAYDLNVLDYLLKPVSFDRLLKAVNKFFQRYPESITTSSFVAAPFMEEVIYIKADRKMHKIKLSEICYIESLNDYVKVHLKSKYFITRENISTLEKRLPTHLFVRIHRSFLIALNHMDSFSPEGVDILGKLLPFGRTFKQNALSIIQHIKN